MSLDEMEQSIDAQINGHTHVHTRFDFVDVSSELLQKVFKQIKQAVMLINIGIESPEDHKAEAYLLMLLERAYHHGYTPKEIK